MLMSTVVYATNSGGCLKKHIICPATAVGGTASNVVEISVMSVTRRNIASAQSQHTQPLHREGHPAGFSPEVLPKGHMPTPSKPCDGKLTQEVQQAIQRNRNREQWASHRCETCGRNVGVELVMGHWTTERHWPTVAYRPRKSVTQPIRPLSALQLTPEL